MVTNIILFIVGLLLIIVGANLLTDGASAIARRFGISPLVVGLTVVAFGTSTPELIVSLTSAINGYGDMSMGNIVGSNIFNNLAIIGITALITPLVVGRKTLKIELPFMLLSFLILTILSFDNLFSGLSESNNYLSRSDGMILLVFFVFFMIYTLHIAKESSQNKYQSLVVEQEKQNKPKTKLKPIWFMIVFVLVGLGALIYGGDLFVSASSNIARYFHVSEAIIGLTLVAGGTSLPELATGIVAAIKKEADIALGNVIGSCIFNVLLILGLSATIHPIIVRGINLFDIGAMIISGVLLFLFSAFYGKRVINRVEGFLLLIVFIAYYVVILSHS